MVSAVDDEGQPIVPDDLPLMTTLATRMPAHRRLHLVDDEHGSRAIEVTSIPLAGLHGDFLGAVALFWVLPQ